VDQVVPPSFGDPEPFQKTVKPDSIRAAAAPMTSGKPMDRQRDGLVPAIYTPHRLGAGDVARLQESSHPQKTLSE
jgi:hypothetical protein